MSKKTKRISVALVLALSLLAYNFSKDIFKIGVKDGKATRQAMATK